MPLVGSEPSYPDLHSSGVVQGALSTVLGPLVWDVRSRQERAG